jgi:hypothetical protein
MAGLFKGFIDAWNAEPNHSGAEIGTQKDYIPRMYKNETIPNLLNLLNNSLLYRPSSANKREAEDLSDTHEYQTNLFQLWHNYAYAMSKYMAFYDLEDYRKDRVY